MDLDLWVHAPTGRRPAQRLSPPVGARSYYSASRRYRFSGTRTSSRSSVCAPPIDYLCFPAMGLLASISNPSTCPCSWMRSDCRLQMAKERSFRSRRSRGRSAPPPRCQSERRDSPTGNRRRHWPNGFARHINQPRQHQVRARADAVQKFAWDRPWLQRSRQSSDAYTPPDNPRTTTTRLAARYPCPPNRTFDRVLCPNVRSRRTPLSRRLLSISQRGRERGY